MNAKPALEMERVHEFVAKAHGDLAYIEEMIAEEPALVNATWDWGGGDFETALGAASHVGRKDIANYLLEHGARLDIFAAAMLGNLDVVQAAIEAHPNAIHTPGPHGIPLIKHAEAGGGEAKAVLDFLNTRI